MFFPFSFHPSNLTEGEEGGTDHGMSHTYKNAYLLVIVSLCLPVSGSNIPPITGKGHDGIGRVVFKNLPKSCDCMEFDLFFSKSSAHLTDSQYWQKLLMMH